MKRHGNLYSKIVSYDNISLAHEKAQKNKRHYSAVIEINKNKKFYLLEIQKQLKNKTFKNSDYDIFIKKGKKDRIVYKLPYFPDRIVQHAIMNIIEPIWKKILIRDTYSAIKNRGIHDGVNRVKVFLKDKHNTKYCLKMDIEKYYPNVNNTIMKKIIRQKIKCKDTLWLLDSIIDSAVGIPIGNYLSQYLGNLYLSPLDYWIKHTLKIKYYARYCDDFIILHKDKKFLHEIRGKIELFLNERLKLKLKGNYQVFPVEKHGIDFLGYVFFHNKTKIRKDIVLSFYKKIKNIKQNWEVLKYSQIVNTVMSYYGWFAYADSNGLWNKIVDKELKEIMAIVCAENGIVNPLNKRKIRYGSIRYLS